MAKLECNDVEIVIEKFNISEIVIQNIITFINEINERNITPKINIGDEEVFALGDKSSTNIVITNLKIAYYIYKVSYFFITKNIGNSFGVLLL